jgi:hypothetical protein
MYLKVQDRKQSHAFLTFTLRGATLNEEFQQRFLIQIREELEFFIGRSPVCIHLLTSDHNFLVTLHVSFQKQYRR